MMVTRAKTRMSCLKCEKGIPHTFRHGTVNGYRYHNCGCAPCTAAASDAAYAMSRRARAAREAGEKRMPRGKHGTKAGYFYYGCRKECCKAAMRQYYREYREKKRNGFKVVTTK